MTVQEFFDKWVGKSIDFDGIYGFQCVDLFKQYNKEVVGSPNVNGNAIDYWNTYPQGYTKVPNSATNCPVAGDVIIWGKLVGQFGHIAICKVADANQFTSLDQNWYVQIDGTGTCQFITHTYYGVLGWLRPTSLIEQTPAEEVITDMTEQDLINFIVSQKGKDALDHALTDGDEQSTFYNRDKAKLWQKVNEIDSRPPVQQVQPETTVTLTPDASNTASLSPMPADRENMVVVLDWIKELISKLKL